MMMRLSLMVVAIVVSGMTLLDVSPADDGTPTRVAVGAIETAPRGGAPVPESFTRADPGGIDDISAPTRIEPEPTPADLDPVEALRVADDLTSIYAAMKRLGVRARSNEVTTIVEQRVFDFNEDGAVRGSLLYCWSRVGGPVAGDLAARVLDVETNVPLRRAAVRTLGRSNVPFDGERLVRVLEESRDVVERRFAAAGLAMGPLTPRAIAALRRALEDPTADDVLRKNVASTLAIKSRSESGAEADAALDVNRDAWNRMSDDTRRAVLDPDVAKRIQESERR